MGDRANIKLIHDDDSTIYLYTHWGGSELPNTLKAALARRERWSDEPYLHRIIASEVIRSAGGFDSETGSGITTYITDGEYAVIEVHVTTQTVTIKDRTFSFEDFIDPANNSVISELWR